MEKKNPPPKVCVVVHLMGKNQTHILLKVYLGSMSDVITFQPGQSERDLTLPLNALKG